MTASPGQGSPWYFDDFRVGQRFASHGRTITETDVVMFAGWSWDANPVHTDAVAQRASRFGQRIAHGALGLSVALGLASRLGVFDHAAVALLGVDSWVFDAPICIGDTLRVEVEIVGARRSSREQACRMTPRGHSREWTSRTSGMPNSRRSARTTP